MEDENYKLLLEENDKLNKKIEELEKKINDVCSFNKTLLNRGEQPSTQNNTSRKEDLQKKLEGGLRR